MSITYSGKTLIREQIELALNAATLLREFEAKHAGFLDANPPGIVSGNLREPWVSFPAKCAEQVAEHFGNEGWTVTESAREKIVDGIAVAVHGLGGQRVRVPLVASVSHLDVVTSSGCKIGIANQSLN